MTASLVAFAALDCTCCARASGNGLVASCSRKHEKGLEQDEVGEWGYAVWFSGVGVASASGRNFCADAEADVSKAQHPDPTMRHSNDSATVISASA